MIIRLIFLFLIAGLQLALAQVDFNTEIQPIFNNNCAFVGCHGGGSPAQGMNLSAGQSYDNIVNVASSEVPSLDRIEPFEPANSYLYMKITNAPGIVGSRMPLGGNPLPQATIDLIVQWINEGATETPVGIEDPLDGPVTTFALFQNYPNPFNPETTIRYQVPQLSDVRLAVFNLLGQEVRLLLNLEAQPSGRYSVTWDGRDDFGRQVASGVYFYKLITGAEIITRKMMLLR